MRLPDSLPLGFPGFNSMPLYWVLAPISRLWTAEEACCYSSAWPVLCSVSALEHIFDLLDPKTLD
jgi:hypothetical protein